MSPSSELLPRAYAACQALARSHYENFPVASHLLPAPMRPHVAALYAFARVADDIADEGQAGQAERRAQLHAWKERIHRAVEGDAGASASALDRDSLIACALGHSIRSFDLPLSLFDDLLSAFDQDTMTTRYTCWADVFDYCRRSANPVGRLVLRMAGYRDDRLDRSSDALCTALQLTNFWQDLGRDWRAGRLYVPAEEQFAAGATEAQLATRPMADAWVRVLGRCLEVTRAQFDAGRFVCDRVGGRLRWELRATWLGGMRTLDRANRQRAQLIDERPRLGAVDVPWLLWQMARWRTAAGHSVQG
ncbi:MAG: squalene synthase HpnC [Acidobacteriota bacterium]